MDSILKKVEKPEDLVAPEIEVKLAMFPEPLKVRSCALADDIWVKQKFGRYIEEVVQDPKAEELIVIFFRLLEVDSQRLFLAQEQSFVDENGIEFTRKIGGADLLAWRLKGGKELILITRAILRSIGFSRPQLEEAEKDAVKKNLIPDHLRSEPAGMNSSTSSPTNTDGPPSTSSVAL